METELKREEQRNELDKAEPLTTEVSKSAMPARPAAGKYATVPVARQRGKTVGSVLVDEHTNSLIIQAIPSDLRRMIAVVDQIDRPISQILIQAYIVETSNDTARLLVCSGWVGLRHLERQQHLGRTRRRQFRGQNVYQRRKRQPDRKSMPLGNISNFPIPSDNIGLSLASCFKIRPNRSFPALQALQQEP